MKVLWINMTVPPEADAVIGGIKELKNTGGWVLGLAGHLINVPEVELAICAASPLVKELTFVQGEKIKYYIVPQSSGTTSEDNKQIANWKEVYSQFTPDVIHIHGSEYPHALTWLKANGAARTLLSLQGIMVTFKKYYNYGLSQFEILSHITPRDIYRGTLFQDAKAFGRQANIEHDILNLVHHVAGRTDWDRKTLWAINKDAKYHFCNEILRKEFYTGEKWNYDECDKFSIFVNQAAVPYKGLHMLIKALPLVLREYPQTKVRVAGFDITDKSLKRRIMRTGYGSIIIDLLKENDVRDKVSFTGRLNAEEMKKEYLRANAFVLPSAIENSSNALGEAQILGVPCIAANVGGMATIIPNSECGTLYRQSDTVELAYAICETFKNSAKFDNTTERETSMRRHNPQTNVSTLIDIYKELQNE